MKVNLLTQNSKLKKTSEKNDLKIFDFSLPAIKTCPNAGKCKSFCYGNKGFYKIYPNVLKAQLKRLELTKTNDFISLIQKELNKKKIEAVRIHSSGDFYSSEYLIRWIRIAELNPFKLFYFYTKQIDFIQKYKGLFPKNFIYIQSFGGKLDNRIDLKEKHAKIFKCKDEMKKEGYLDCSDNDLNVLNTTKIGLLYH